jgi:ribulose-5-phosphate 4-epimerase/fuculose-1-phosphate aldolase
MTEHEARVQIVHFGRALYARAYASGTSGNLSVRLGDGRFVMTPTNVSLGELNPDRLSLLSAAGAHVSGDMPTKEAWLHLAMYAARPADGAIVHLHSTYATALSCLSGRDPADMLPAITPYVVMRVGAVALVPYNRPGDQSAGATISEIARRHRAVLLANHGPVTAGSDLAHAVAVAEELEETARLYFLLQGHAHRLLDAEQVGELRRVFGS